ncbi:tyrosine-type recombinase/integrase [bacterium]|nr:tyrosine-type recombinase/integrase [bacterium]MBU1993182.1 tyrosine-type recombinase/integrase [bacterium]
MQIQYLTQNSSGIYTYRRRTPTELQEILQKDTIKVSIGKDLSLAISKTNQFTQAIQQSIQVLQMQTQSKDKNELIKNILEPIGFKTSIKEVVTPLWELICKDYLKSVDVSADELRDRSYFFFTIAPIIFKAVLKIDNPNINEISFNNILDFQHLIATLPKRNIQKYRDMNFSLLVLGIKQNKISIKDDELLSTRTKNKYIKWLKAIFSFADVRDLITKNVTKSIVLKNTTKQREEREALSKDELKILFTAIQNNEISYLFRILQLTGMRRSELYKCSIKHYDGVACFDLSASSEKLKTASSYRLIPIHSSLLADIEKFEAIRKKYSGNYLSQYFARLIKLTLDEAENKSLYSLRHTFATQLIAKSVAPEIVSELMGHAHATMTMSRYVKSYPVEILREAVEKL